MALTADRPAEAPYPAEAGQGIDHTLCIAAQAAHAAAKFGDRGAAEGATPAAVPCSTGAPTYARGSSPSSSTLPGDQIRFESASRR